MWENQWHSLTFIIFLYVKTMIVSKTSIKSQFSSLKFLFTKKIILTELGLVYVNSVWNVSRSIVCLSLS